MLENRYSPGLESRGGVFTSIKVALFGFLLPADDSVRNRPVDHHCFSRLSPSERVNCSLEVSPAKQELFKEEVPGEYHGRFHGGRFGFSAGRLPRACS